MVKHLAPPYEARLLTRPDLVRRARQFHLRPFNGHHCQVPVTNGRGQITPEFEQWLPFAEKVMETWLGDPANREAEFFAMPEMGPVSGGYNLSILPNSWKEAVRLRDILDQSWRKLVRRVSRARAKKGC